MSIMCIQLVVDKMNECEEGKKKALEANKREEKEKFSAIQANKSSLTNGKMYAIF